MGSAEPARVLVQQDGKVIMGYGEGFAEEMLRPPRLPAKPAPMPSSQWLKRNPEQAAAMGYDVPGAEGGPGPRPQGLPRRSGLQEELPRYTPEEKLAMDVERTKQIGAARWEAGAAEREYDAGQDAATAEAKKQEDYNAWREKEREWLNTTEAEETKREKRRKRISAAVLAEAETDGVQLTPEELDQQASDWLAEGGDASDITSRASKQRDKAQKDAKEEAQLEAKTRIIKRKYPDMPDDEAMDYAVSGEKPPEAKEDKPVKPLNVAVVKAQATRLARMPMDELLKEQQALEEALESEDEGVQARAAQMLNGLRDAQRDLVEQRQKKYSPEERRDKAKEASGE